MATSVFDLAATLTLNSSDYEKGLEQSERKANSFASKIGSGLKAVGTAGVAAVGAATAGVVALTKAAVDGYADYQQLVGGVETLFGAGGMSLEEYARSIGKTTGEAKKEFDSLMNAQNTMLKNADDAYQKQGLSANEYMETATGMAAAMIGSLGGDTNKAAEMVDMAMTDMSDNANKMGTDIASIQNAYSGFAKQNYTMLDNLKIGYGGTKEEMARLIDDANKLKEAQGEVGDLSINSYADIVEAIHTVQTEMGITGTTAKEASTTISGSLASARSAWTNLLTAFGRGNKETKKATKAFISSVVTAAKNIVPAVSQALMGIAEFVTDLAPEIASKLPQLLSELLPKVSSTVGQLLRSLGTILTSWTGSAVTLIVSSIGSVDWKNVGNTIVDGIKKSLSTMVQWAKGYFTKVSEAINAVDWAKLGKDMMSSIIGAFGSIVGFFTGKFSDAKDGVGGIDWKGLGLAIWEYIKSAFSAVGTWLYSAFDVAKEQIKQVDWKGVGESVWNAIKSAFLTVGSWLHSAFEVAKAQILSVDWLQLGSDLWGKIVEGIGDIVDWATKKFTEAKDAINNVDWKQLGTDMMNAILNAFDHIVDFFVGENGIFTKAKNDIETGIDWKGLGLSIWGLIKSAFTGIGNWFLGAFEVAVARIKSINWLDVGLTILGFIKNAFVGIGKWFYGVFFANDDSVFKSITKNISWSSAGTWIWEAVKNAMKGIKTWFGNRFNEAITAVTGLGWGDMGTQLWTDIKTGIGNVATWFKTKFETASTWITSLIDWDSVGTKIWSGITSFANGIWTWIFTNIGDGDNTQSLLGALLDVNWSDIGDKVFSAIQSGFNSAVEWIKQQLFEWKLPTPHIVRTYSQIGPFQIPDFTIEWYARAKKNPTLFTGATLFGAGEAGDEILYGHSSLMDDIKNAVADAGVRNDDRLYNLLASILPQIAESSKKQIVLDDGTIVGIIDDRMGQITEAYERGA